MRAQSFDSSYFDPASPGHETQCENLPIFRIKAAHDLLKIELSNDRILDGDRRCSFRVGSVSLLVAHRDCRANLREPSRMNDEHP
jgi:hypothetical protein